MSSVTLDLSWQADPSGLWTLSATSAPAYVSSSAIATSVRAQSGSASPPPFAEHIFTTPLDLSAFAELRFWLRSTRAADGSAAKPFYLAFEVANDSLGLSWQRLLPVRQPGRWELHRLWLGDMENGLSSLRQAVAALRLRSLDASVSFTAATGETIAATPEPVQDVDAALLARLDRRFAIPGIPTNIPAFVDLPENPGDRTAPYILIVPWAIQPLRERGGSGEIVDNYLPEGAFIRPHPWQIQLEYSIDVYAQDRSQKALLLDRIVSNLSRQPFLMVAGEPLVLSTFVPSPESTVKYNESPGRTPLFYRLTALVEVGDRQFQMQASPFFLIGPTETPSTEAEPVLV